MQGGAESSPLSWNTFEQVRAMACHGAQQLFALYDSSYAKATEDKQKTEIPHDSLKQSDERVPMFSLKNRQKLLS
jgi:hypothetical protein